MRSREHDAGSHASHPDDDTLDIRTEISLARELVVYAVLATLVAGFGAALVRETELFPFSYFPMYSQSRAGVTTSSSLAWVAVANGRELEITRPQLQALIQTRKKYLDRYVNRHPGRPERVTALLAKFARLYDERRGRVAGLPAADAFRIYRLEYDLDPWARNREDPDRGVLLYEYEVRAGREPPP